MSEGDAEVIGPRSCRCLLFAIRRTQHCLGCDGCRYCRATMAVASGRVNSIWNWTELALVVPCGLAIPAPESFVSVVWSRLHFLSKSCSPRRTV
jgi:hypothetical protein